MSALIDKFLIPIAVGLVVIGLATVVGWLYQCRRTTPTPPRVLRRYSLLGTTGADGSPRYYESTLPPGSVVTRRVGSLSQRFELTEAPLGDGTYAAEPLDHL